MLTYIWIERFYVMNSKPVLDVCPPIKRRKSNTTNVSTCLFCKKNCHKQHSYTTIVLHYNSPCATESPSYHNWISQNGVYIPRRYQKPSLQPSISVPPLKKITYDQQFKEDEDEAIIQGHEIIIESENIYTDEELSADDYVDCIVFILFRVYHFSRFSF